MSKTPIKEIGRKALLLDKLEPMPGNREFGSGMTAKSIKELADSITAVGLQQDLVVREHPERKGRYQIICGCRRHAAAEKAGLKEAPCRIIEADDKTAYEVRCIENLQRADLHELEEAMEFQNLLRLLDEKQKPVHTWDSIAKQVGKSAAYVRARVKLLDMPDLAKQAFLNTKMSASIALLICRIPDPKLAHKATVEVLDRVWHKEENALNEEIEPMSYRDAKKHIQDTYMKRLKGCLFDPEDAALVPEFDAAGQDIIAGSDPKARCGGGKCSNCPSRTANMKALYPDLGSEDVCTNPTCYQLKVKAHEKRLADKLKERGQTLIPGRKAEKVVQADGSLTWQGREKFAQLNAKVGDGKKAKTVGEVLEAAGVTHEVHVAQVQPAEGKTKSIPLVPLDEKVVAALQEAGAEVSLPDAAKSAEQRQQEEQTRKERHAFLTQVGQTACEALGQQIRLAKNFADVRGAVGAAVLSSHDRPFTPKGVKKLEDGELFALMFESQCLISPVSYQATELRPEFIEICETFGVDVKTILKKAEADADKK